MPLDFAKEAIETAEKNSINFDELKAGKTKELTFYLPEHWIYDPNCEMKIVIDPEKSIKDCDWENNTELYFAWG
jgi:hypothetical protein